MNRLLSRLRALGCGRHPRYTLASPDRDGDWERTRQAVEDLNGDLGHGGVRELFPGRGQDSGPDGGAAA